MLQEKIIFLLKEALEEAQVRGELQLPSPLPQIELEQPRDRSHGDWASNIALILSSRLKKPPEEIAKIITSHLKLPSILQTVEVSAGFINFKLSLEYLYGVLKEIQQKKEKFGCRSQKEKIKVQVEFVSANPVGPMHIGHGRWAAVGDSLARLLKTCGYEVVKEFYINDYGNQMKVFGASVAARYQQLLGQDVPFPEEGYQGHWITEIAQEIIDKEGERYLNLSPTEQQEIFTERAYRQVLEHLKDTLASMDVIFDNWFSERSLHESGYLEETLKELEVKDFVFKKDGALWFKTTLLGDDKDRVLIRENGKPTYFAADVAYHRNKLSRGFKKIINIWGADHHGYISRMKAAMRALGASDDVLEIILGQLVNLFDAGKPVRMSKRTGEMVTLEELLKEVGKDPTRFFFLMRSTDTPLDFDIELAKSQSEKNPVYYVQYAHARICSILRMAASQGVKLIPVEKVELPLLSSKPELNLIRQLAFADVLILRAAENRAPYLLTKYAQDLAATFHFFYNKCRVLGEKEALTFARLTLVDCTRLVLKIILNLIGVEAPERM